jgi:3-hydroxybutyryl-CoA dehydrogenase
MQIEQVAVVGAGAMGRGIAQIAAAAGFQVRLQDIEQEQLNEARGVIEENMEGAVKREKLTEEEMDEALGRVSLFTSLEESA